MERNVHIRYNYANRMRMKSIERPWKELFMRRNKNSDICNNQNEKFVRFLAMCLTGMMCVALYGDL